MIGGHRGRGRHRHQRRCAPQTGAITLDPGYGNTGACESAITFIDGEKRHPALPRLSRSRSSPSRPTFIEVGYLLIYGELPTAAELAEFRPRADLPHPAPRGHEALLRGLPGDRPPDGDPVGDGRLAVVLLPGRRERRGRADSTSCGCWRKVRTIAAFSYKKSIGQPFIYPRNDLSYSANFLHMMFAVPAEPYRISPVVERRAEPAPHPARRPRAELLTSTVRMVGSSQANLFASISAGICALWGPLHGGANQEVLEMLETIQRRRRRRPEVRRAWPRTRRRASA